MNIAVICKGRVDSLPPVLSLLASLKRLGQRVTLITDEGSALNGRGIAVDEVIDFGRKGTGPFARKMNSLSFRQGLRTELRNGLNKYDLVWTTTDISAREAGRDLLRYKYVIQLMELVDKVPLMQDSVPLYTNEVRMLAQHAWKVVVPEYNRAYMQQVYWSLPTVPCVIPNKPAYQNEEVSISEGPYLDLLDQFASERKKVILYQGGFAPDRDLVPFARAIEHVKDSFALYLMGPTSNPTRKAFVDDLCGEFDSVHYLGFVEPPYHLCFSQYSWIGLLPYRPTWGNRFSPFNALYCAPNKIWEYTAAGLPVLSSDVPGVRQAIESGGFGLAVSTGDERGIIDAVNQIDSHHEEMSRNSREYYDSFDYDQMISRVLELN